MDREKIAKDYDKIWLEIDRPQPLSDQKIEKLIHDVLNGNLDKDISDAIYINFKKEMTNWLLSSKLNTIRGLENFNRVDIINGCTQFIDTLYMQHSIQIIEGDYKYHQRLNHDICFSNPGSLIPNVPLIIAAPFPSIGNIHPHTIDIFNEAFEKNISVHIDGAWLTCSRNINFNVDHPAIKSVAISLSKGLGLGWNRIGLRWTKNLVSDAITLQNDFKMNLRAPVIIGLHFLRNLNPDHLWNTHDKNYEKICNDFGLTPTNSIHIALQNLKPVGLAPLIRYLDEHDQ
jgi:hypothetical protein